MLSQILLVVLIILAWIGLRSILQQRHRAALRREQNGAVRGDGPSGGQPGRTTEHVEEMVRCDHCGVFVPRHQAVASSGRLYCSDNCRLEDRS